MAKQPRPPRIHRDIPELTAGRRRGWHSCCHLPAGTTLGQSRDVPGLRLGELWDVQVPVTTLHGQIASKGEKGRKIKGDFPTPGWPRWVRAVCVRGRSWQCHRDVSPEPCPEASRDAGWAASSPGRFWAGFPSPGRMLRLDPSLLPPRSLPGSCHPQRCCD